jgi:hypothetical protein
VVNFDKHGDDILNSGMVAPASLIVAARCFWACVGWVQCVTASSSLPVFGCQQAGACCYTIQTIIFNYFQKSLDIAILIAYISIYSDGHPSGERMKDETGRVHCSLKKKKSGSFL